MNTEEINDTPGIPGFWLKALKAHHLVSDYIKKHDEPILKLLKNIKGRNFTDQHGYELTFSFEPNKYMETTELVKSYHLLEESILEKTDSTKIVWKEGMDPTKKKVKKKQKNKKTGATRTITKTVDQESFFTFFQALTLPDSDAMDKLGKDEADEMAGKMDEDYDLGNDIMNDIIPEAFELYLGVVDKDYSSLNSSTEEENGEGEDGEGEGDDDQDDKGKKSTSPAGKDGVDCKQQ